MKKILAVLAILCMVSLTHASTFQANFDSGDTVSLGGGLTSVVGSDTPEPTSLALMSVGSLVLLASRRRKV